MITTNDLTQDWMDWMRNRRRDRDAPDPRIVYGAMCMWWDSIDKVAALKDSGLPCCPHCGGLLLEFPDIDQWNAAIAKRSATEPDYPEFIAWLRGKCFKSLELAQEAYRFQKG